MELVKIVENVRQRYVSYLEKSRIEKEKYKMAYERGVRKIDLEIQYDGALHAAYLLHQDITSSPTREILSGFSEEARNIKPLPEYSPLEMKAFLKGYRSQTRVDDLDHPDD